MFFAVLALVVFVAVIIYNSFFKSNKRTRSKSSRSEKSWSQTVTKTFGDKYNNLEQVQEALRKKGLESSNLIIAVDYTKSNETNGRNTFNGKSLHMISQTGLNPYQRAISVVGRTLEPFDEDHLIPAFGFGDLTTKDRAIFNFFPDGRPSKGLQEVLRRYSELTPHVTLSGPTSFAPIIWEAIRVVRASKSYHILVIVADGQVTSPQETIKAIVEASNYPLSIIVVGVGDGPWDQMEEFDDELPQRQFDNFQFVDSHKHSTDVEFALAALMEIPQQFSAIKKLGLL
eukprot:TRINITY_DN16531_c0_g1_i1.p1 TRINITY_DN16531_c0_g1~~TRINITY_DN16531_c0_g1_i1.p1  ORF type:complete len:294 (+),score=81.50 TRINITY_DN16531_c0_g1_i1:27-884(+)